MDLSSLPAATAVTAGGTMQGLLDAAAWKACRETRKRQRRLGAACALLLALALLGMVDGLQGVMRSGADVLDLLPGEGAGLSGPLTIKNPVNSDLQARSKPESSPFSFQLEGFFAGYWFGNGMWRGTVTADAAAEPGEYSLRIVFKGAAASTAQQFTVQIYADAQAMRAASTSFLRRFTGYNPFVLAAVFSLSGILLGIGVYRQGSRYIRQLVGLGCGEVVRAGQEEGGYRIWCLLFGARSPVEGTSCAVLNAEGVYLGQARAATADKGTLEMLMTNCSVTSGAEYAKCDAVQPGCLVLLRPSRPHSPPGMGS